MDRSDDPSSCSVPQELVETLIMSCSSAKKTIVPLIEKLSALEAKGFNKTGEDLIEIRSLRSEIQAELKKAMENPGIPRCKCIITGPSQSAPRKETTPRGDLVSFDNLNTDHQTFATADTNMFFTEWSPNFIHGSDSMIHIMSLAETLLQEGEKITALDRITWKKPMRHNLQLAVYAQEFANLPDREKYIVEGSFTTSNGRKFTVFGMDNPNSPIKTRMTNNPYANRTICPCPDCCQTAPDGTQSFKIHEPPVSKCYEAFAKSKPLSAATLIEMLTLALFRTDETINNRERTKILKVLGGLSDLPIPEDMDVIFNGNHPGEGNSRLEVRFLKGAEKKGQSGMTLMPFEYKFPHQKTFSRGIAASTDSIDLARKF